MKSIFNKIGKFLFYFTYPILLIGLIASLGFNFYQNREIQQTNELFEETTQDLNQENESKEGRIEDLRSSFEQLNNEVESLTTENEQLKQQLDNLQTEGLGTITGRIFPIVSSTNEGFSQYQLVCARTVENDKLAFCRSVSALQQNFELQVPTGTYEVYAQIFPQPPVDSELANAKAFYTELIECVRANQENCNEDQLANPIPVQVEPGQTVTEVDPIDWN